MLGEEFFPLRRFLFMVSREGVVGEAVRLRRVLFFPDRLEAGLDLGEGVRVAFLFLDRGKAARGLDEGVGLRLVLEEEVGLGAVLVAVILFF